LSTVTHCATNLGERRQHLVFVIRSELDLRHRARCAISWRKRWKTAGSSRERKRPNIEW